MTSARRHVPWIAVLIAAAAMWALPGHPAAQARTAARPNVVYIYADDLGYGELGAYGQKKIRTPNLDRMAREGLRFTSHYASSPVCAPSRAMLLTGLHAGHSYIRGNYELGGFADEHEGGQMPLAPHTPTIARLLQRAGYATGAIGKWGLGMHDNTGDPNQQGFDYFFGYLDQKQAHNYYPTHLWENGRRVPLRNAYFSPHQKLASAPADPAAYDKYRGTDYAPELMTERALSFIDRYRDRPFFLYVPYTIPHLALQAPVAAVQAYVGQFEERPYLGEAGYLPARYPLSTYAGMITTLDAYVGTILEHLRAGGLEERTLVMFSSDNGPTFTVGGVQRAFFDSTAGLRGGKMEVYEGGIRVPFIARWPGRVPAGQVSDHVSAQFDLPATLAELVGVEPLAGDGISLVPTLLGRPQEQQRHKFLYFEYPENGGQLAVRLGRWKGVRVGMKKQPAAPWQLYDLTADRGETTDVASRHPDVLRELDAIVTREHRRAHIREWEFVDSRLPPGTEP
jgi:arylsulfatase A